MAAFNREEASCTSLLPAVWPLRMRVSRSSMGSVMLMASAPHQLALARPGISPRLATSRIFTRASPNLRYTPRERPVIAHRLRCRDGLASRGCACSAAIAAARSSGELLGLRISSLSLARLAAYFFTIPARRFSRSTMLVFAIRGFLLLAEREVESLEQRSPHAIVAGRRGDGDVHAPHLIDLVVLDLGEDDLLLDPERVVAAAVEGARRDAAEITDARHCDVDQAVEELVHAPPAQRHLGSDLKPGADLERSDRLARLGDERLLPGDLGEIRQRRVHDLLLRHRLAH